jgi:hypothetical protein
MTFGTYEQPEYGAVINTRLLEPGLRFGQTGTVRIEMSTGSPDRFKFCAHGSIWEIAYPRSYLLIPALGDKQ